MNLLSHRAWYFIHFITHDYSSLPEASALDFETSLGLVTSHGIVWRGHAVPEERPVAAPKLDRTGPPDHRCPWELPERRPREAGESERGERGEGVPGVRGRQRCRREQPRPTANAQVGPSKATYMYIIALLLLTEQFLTSARCFCFC